MSFKISYEESQKILKLHEAHKKSLLKEEKTPKEELEDLLSNFPNNSKVVEIKKPSGNVWAIKVANNDKTKYRYYFIDGTISERKEGEKTLTKTNLVWDVNGLRKNKPIVLNPIVTTSPSSPSSSSPSSSSPSSPSSSTIPQPIDSEYEYLKKTLGEKEEWTGGELTSGHTWSRNQRPTGSNWEQYPFTGLKTIVYVSPKKKTQIFKNVDVSQDIKDMELGLDECKNKAEEYFSYYKKGGSSCNDTQNHLRKALQKCKNEHCRFKNGFCKKGVLSDFDNIINFFSSKLKSYKNKSGLGKLDPFNIDLTDEGYKSSCKNKR